MSGSLTSLPPNPRSFGQILDRIYRLFRSNFRLFIGIAIFPPLIFFATFALVLAFSFRTVFEQLAKNPSPEVFFRHAPALIPVFLVFILLQMTVLAIYFAAGSYAAVQADLGIKVTVRDSYAIAWAHAGRCFLLFFLIYLVCFLPALLAELVIFAGISTMSTINSNSNMFVIMLILFGFLLYFAAIVYGYIMVLRFSLAFPASLAERMAAVTAMRRSSRLTRGAKGRIFLVLLIVYAVTYLALLIAMCVLMLLCAIVYLPLSAMHLHPSQPLQIVAASCAGLFFLGAMAFYMAISWAGFVTAFAVLYNDQRSRIDGAAAPFPPAGAFT
jgi:hypothetical protein